MATSLFCGVPKCNLSEIIAHIHLKILQMYQTVDTFRNLDINLIYLCFEINVLLLLKDGIFRPF